MLEPYELGQSGTARPAPKPVTSPPAAMSMSVRTTKVPVRAAFQLISRRPGKREPTVAPRAPRAAWKRMDMGIQRRWEGEGGGGAGGVGGVCEVRRPVAPGGGIRWEGGGGRWGGL